jgi:hypothetical protein
MVVCNEGVCLSDCRAIGVHRIVLRTMFLESGKDVNKLRFKRKNQGGNSGLRDFKSPSKILNDF